MYGLAWSGMDGGDWHSPTLLLSLYNLYIYIYIYFIFLFLPDISIPISHILLTLSPSHSLLLLPLTTSLLLCPRLRAAPSRLLLVRGNRTTRHLKMLLNWTLGQAWSIFTMVLCSTNRYVGKSSLRFPSARGQNSIYIYPAAPGGAQLPCEPQRLRAPLPTISGFRHGQR
jgi:hypothetical protein